MTLPRVRFTVRRLLVLVSLVTGPGVSAQDHLIPERGAINAGGAEHELALRRSLFKGAEFAPYRARVVCVPPFKSAWAATLACEGEDGDRAAYFILYAEFVGGAGDGLEGVDVRQVRAPLDRKTGEAIQRLWLTMLRRVRYPEHPVAGADGVTYHFSRFVQLLSDDPLAPSGWESGQVWTPDPASPPGRLAALGVRLRAYAMAPPAERPQLQDRLLRDAASLQSDLDQRSRPSGRHPD